MDPRGGVDASGMLMREQNPAQSPPPHPLLTSASVLYYLISLGVTDFRHHQSLISGPSRIHVAIHDRQSPRRHTTFDIQATPTTHESLTRTDIDCT
jgi:hypothetical protein